MRIYRRPVRIEILVVLIVLTVACGAGQTASPSTTRSTTSPSTTTTIPTDDTSTTTTTTTSTTIGTEIDVEISDGEVAGPDRFEFARDDQVGITVLSDTAYEIHVHGYDLRFEVEPGVPYTVEFIAEVPGIFEVETHPDHLLVFEIVVSG